MRIGSVQTGKMNFNKDQRYFDAGSQDHFRAGIPSIVNDVKEKIDRDILGTKKPKWTSSVGMVGHPKEEHISKTLFDIRQGLQDEAPGQTRAQHVYEGTDTRDVYHSGWNVSTECVQPRDNERFIQATYVFST